MSSTAISGASPLKVTVPLIEASLVSVAAAGCTALVPLSEPEAAACSLPPSSSPPQAASSSIRAATGSSLR